ncbi:uroporphyrinogen-III synthase [Cryptosporangium aurantiacum]|uniref:Uroporphyrinogen-III synthase n=1 Tax=Cryptosporangium aurantiacum TaxID=134849 RepID=A0A1M7QED7_9ACTN|nr:uroporphyrinogen-III synthase [Cryptosporangium aurantiacum]SHN28865.1 uroporphyrinogen-III synthase [Cryptosporangium aurantiacum]
MSELEGFTVAVTAERRKEELAALLERRGARVVLAPALRIIPLPDDEMLAATTRGLLENPPDIVVATTGIGFRGWMEATEGWGLADPLRAVLHEAAVLARGPKARGAIRAAGLTEAWHAASETSAEVLSYLLELGVAGKRVAIQLHGEPLRDVAAALTDAGAEVVEVEVYRWVPPEDPAPLRRLVESVCAGSVDAVTFTSAAASANFLATADDCGKGEAVVKAFATSVLAVCVGPVTASVLVRRGIPVVSPERYRLGALVRSVATELPARCPTFQVKNHQVQVRGFAVMLDGVAVAAPPASMAVLRALASRPGRVFSRAELREVLPAGDAGDHAVEMAITRLRAALGEADLVETVIKRGYRLRTEVVLTSAMG